MTVVTAGGLPDRGDGGLWEVAFENDSVDLRRERLAGLGAESPPGLSTASVASPRSAAAATSSGRAPLAGGS